MIGVTADPSTGRPERANSVLPAPAAAMAAIAGLAALEARAVAAVGSLLHRTGTTRSAPPHLADARRIVVVRLDEIGDVVLTTPFLRELRRAAPRARITLVVKPEVLNLVELCPHVDEVRTHRTSAPPLLGEFVRPIRALRTAVRELRPIGADVAILPRWDADRWGATFLAYWTGAPVRVGHSERVSSFKRMINRGFDRLLTHPVCVAGRRHEADRGLDLLRSLGHEPVDDRLELWTDAADARFADDLLAAHGVGGGDRVVALNPSAGHSVLKQWPLEHFRELATRLAGAARLLVVGAPADAPLGRAIAEAVPGAVVDATGRTTLRQTVALLRRAEVCVTTDTGPMHMAVAAGTRVVALFGPSDYRCYGPRGAHQVVSLDLPCSPATREDKRDRCARCELGEPRCMIDLPVERVAAAVRRAMSGERHLPIAHGA
jgi:ADP-heptose:LPS heptosyltransferase